MHENDNIVFLSEIASSSFIWSVVRIDLIPYLFFFRNKTSTMKILRKIWIQNERFWKVCDVWGKKNILYFLPDSYIICISIFWSYLKFIRTKKKRVKWFPERKTLNWTNDKRTNQTTKCFVFFSFNSVTNPAFKKLFRLNCGS